jgi:hypothetical protein
MEGPKHTRFSRVGVAALAMVAVCSAPAGAQWLNYPAPGIPRLPDGKPNLSAPAPRKPDGKPDLSGVWQGDRDNLRKVVGPGTPPRGLAADFKPGEFPIQPWAEALSKERTAGGRDWPPAHCLPTSIPLLDSAGNTPLKIVQEPDVVVILYEVFGEFRQIFLDGRRLSKDPNPTWLGYSVGRWDGDTWDGDTLVVDTAGFNGKAWLDVAGHPTTEALHITERFERRDFGHLDVQVTIDDPGAYTKPWSVTLSWQLSPDTDLLEDVCNENEKDLAHRVDR